MNRESEPIDLESGQPWRVAFSCVDCQRSVVRLTCADPLALQYCWKCELRRFEMLANEMEPGQRWRVAFSCEDCQRSVVRLTRADPLTLRRCSECEWRRTERVSDEILDLVFGPRSPG